MPAFASPMPLDYSIMPFKPSGEYWNHYAFSDGTIIRFRVIVTRIMKRPSTPAGQYDSSAANLSVVFVPPSERGQPIGSIGPADAQPVDKYEIRPITSEEHWNVYRLASSDDFVKVKYIARNFFILKNKFSQFGEPIYLVIVTLPVTGQPKFGKKGQGGR